MRSLNYLDNDNQNNNRFRRPSAAGIFDPIIKKNEANNYRLISLTSIPPCQLVEQQYIMLHLHERKTWPRSSNSLQQAAWLQAWTFLWDPTVQHLPWHYSQCWLRDNIHAVVLDFVKAFDNVPHQLLMNKLNYPIYLTCVAVFFCGYITFGVIENREWWWSMVASLMTCL